MPITPRPLILASTAPWRADILRGLTSDFQTMAPPYKESFPLSVSPRDLARQHAEGKAKASAQLRPDAFILAADQTAEFMGTCLRKPEDLDSCIRQLSELQGNTHYLHSAIALYSPINQTIACEVVTVTLDMHPLSPEEVTQYVEEDQPLGCVGSYKFELGGKRLFRQIDQDESSIVGLPLDAVSTLLEDADFTLEYRNQG